MKDSKRDSKRDSKGDSRKDELELHLGPLMREVAGAQRLQLAELGLTAEVSRRLAAMQRARPARPERRWRAVRFALPTLAALGAAAAAVVMIGGDRVDDRPLSFAIGAPGGGARAGHAGDEVTTPPGEAAIPLRFSDGTSVTVGSGARVAVAAVDGQGATVDVREGHVELDVRHRARTRWHVRAGAFDVNVTGTRFSVDWSTHGGALTVVMREGVVEIRAPHLGGSSPVIVSAGQRFTARADSPRWEVSAAGASAAVIAPAPGSPAARGLLAGGDDNDRPPAGTPPGEAPAAAGTAPGTRAPTATPGWQELARGGRYPEALAAAERAGFDEACDALPVDDLVLLGDVARLARSAERAVQAYDRAHRRFPRADRPLFALGLVAFEQQHDFRGAARWFDSYVQRHPGGPLAPEAAGRALESWHRAGDAARARRAARVYLRRTPSGPYAALARRIARP